MRKTNRLDWARGLSVMAVGLSLALLIVALVPVSRPRAGLLEVFIGLSLALGWLCLMGAARSRAQGAQAGVMLALSDPDPADTAESVADRFARALHVETGWAVVVYLVDPATDAPTPGAVYPAQGRPPAGEDVEEPVFSGAVTEVGESKGRWLVFPGHHAEHSRVLVAVQGSVTADDKQILRRLAGALEVRVRLAQALGSLNEAASGAQSARVRLGVLRASEAGLVSVDRARLLDPDAPATMGYYTLLESCPALARAGTFDVDGQARALTVYADRVWLEALLAVLTAWAEKSADGPVLVRARRAESSVMVRFEFARAADPSADDAVSGARSLAAIAHGSVTVFSADAGRWVAELLLPQPAPLSGPGATKNPPG